MMFNWSIEVASHSRHTSDQLIDQSELGPCRFGNRKWLKIDSFFYVSVNDLSRTIVLCGVLYLAFDISYNASQPAGSIASTMFNWHRTTLLYVMIDHQSGPPKHRSCSTTLQNCWHHRPNEKDLTSKIHPSSSSQALQVAQILFK